MRCDVRDRFDEWPGGEISFRALGVETVTFLGPGG